MYDSFRKRDFRKHKNQNKVNLQLIDRSSRSQKDLLQPQKLKQKSSQISNDGELNLTEINQSSVRYRTELSQTESEIPFFKYKSVELMRQMNQSILGKSATRELLNQIQKRSKIVKKYEKIINSHIFKTNLNQTNKIIRNSQGIYPTTINVLVSKVDLSFSGTISQIIKIVREEYEFHHGCLFLSDKGIIMNFWIEKHCKVLKVQFQFIKEVTYLHPYLMLSIDQKDQTKTIIIQLKEDQQKSYRWYNFLKLNKEYHSDRRKTKKEKWIKIGIQSYQKYSQVHQLFSYSSEEPISFELEKQQKPKSRRKSIFLNVSTDKNLLSQERKNSISVRTKKSSVKIVQTPQILQDSPKLSNSIESVGSFFSLKLSQIKTEKLAKKIQQKKKLIEMAKLNQEKEDYWGEAQKQGEQNYYILGPHIKKRQTEYYNDEDEIEIRRKVNTNDEKMTTKMRKETGLKDEQATNREHKPTLGSNTESKKQSEQISIFETIESPQKRSNKKSIHKLREEEQRKIFLQKLKIKQSIEKQRQKRDQQSSFTSSSSENEEDFTLQNQQLKNGIVLTKCSPNGWSPHEKKLYLSQNEFELSYCDIANKSDEKKIFIQDIEQIQYQHYGKGISKHIEEVDPKRCMTITFKQGKKTKMIEFVLSVKEPVESLSLFHKKLEAFIERYQKNKKNNS